MDHLNNFNETDDILNEFVPDWSENLQLMKEIITDFYEDHIENMTLYRIQIGFDNHAMYKCSSESNRISKGFQLSKIMSGEGIRFVSPKDTKRDFYYRIDIRISNKTTISKLEEMYNAFCGISKSFQNLMDLKLNLSTIDGSKNVLFLGNIIQCHWNQPLEYHAYALIHGYNQTTKIGDIYQTYPTGATFILWLMPK